MPPYDIVDLTCDESDDDGYTNVNSSNTQDVANATPNSKQEDQPYPALEATQLQQNCSNKENGNGETVARLSTTANASEEAPLSPHAGAPSFLAAHRTRQEHDQTPEFPIQTFPFVHQGAKVQVKYEKNGSKHSGVATAIVQSKPYKIGLIWVVDIQWLHGGEQEMGVAVSRISAPDKDKVGRESQTKPSEVVHTNGKRPAEQQEIPNKRRKTAYLSHELFSNNENQPERLFEPPRDLGGTDEGAELDPLFQSDKYLTQTEMELLWLGEESMFSLGKKEFDFNFIYQYATAALRMRILRLEQESSSADKIKCIIRSQDHLVAHRFEQLRESVRCAFDRGYRRPCMRETIAKSRAELWKQSRSESANTETPVTMAPLSPSKHTIRLRQSVAEQIRRDQERLTGVPGDRTRRAKSASNNGGAQRKYPNGTRFLKKFGRQGTFEGEVVGFNGFHYSIYYAEDNDSEDMTEATLEKFLNQKQTTDRSKWKPPPGGH